MIKTKTQDIITENSFRKNLATQKNLIKESQNLTNKNEVQKKFDECDRRMKSFESAIEEILYFTKKTCMDIHDIQMNLSNNNGSSNKSNAGSFVEHDVMATDLNQKEMNINRQNDSQVPFINLMKPDDGGYSSAVFQTNHNSKPNRSIQIPQHNEKFESSPVQNINEKTAGPNMKSTNLISFQNLSEIDLLKRKLDYYTNQLDTFAGSLNDREVLISGNIHPLNSYF